MFDAEKEDLLIFLRIAVHAAEYIVYTEVSHEESEE